MDPNNDLQSKLDSIDEKINMMMDHLGVSAPEEMDQPEPPAEGPPRKQMLDKLTAPDEGE